MDSPCKNCEKRKVNESYDCHNDCKEYKEWKRNRRYYNKKISEERALEKALDYRSKRWR